MPQGLTRTRADAGQALQVGGRALTAAHEQIVGVLRSRLGQNHAELLAVPKADADGAIAWSTNLTGAVTPAAQLPEDERGKLQQRAERFLGEIRGLAQQLRGEGPASAVLAQMLEQATRQPPGDWLYSVGGRPVLVLWGHAAPGTVVAPVAAAAPAAAAAAATPTAGAVPPVVPPPAAPAAAAAAGSGGWKRWLLWALLALVLLYLLFFAWKRCSETPVADAGLAEQIAQAEARNKALEDELAAKRNAKPQRACVVDPVPPAASAPEPIASAPEPPASQPAPPKPDLKQRIAEAGKDCKALAAMLKNEPELKGNSAQANALKQQILGTMAKNCRDEAIREAKNMCPGQRPKELAPDMAIVFDASGSMDFSVDVSDAQIKQQAGAAAAEALMRQFGLGGLAGAAGNAALERFKREPKRITVAKRAALGVVQRLPSDLNTGLVLVEQCPNARSMGMYGPGQRGALLGQIQGIEPRGGTPLADGIEKGGALVDGVTKDSTIVIISDGVESCGRDPCAVAAALKRAKPRLKINVVDITGTGAGNCAAQITGGRVFTARNAAEVVEQMNRATQDAMGPANCKP